MTKGTRTLIAATITAAFTTMAAQAETTFRLESVRSGSKFGPYSFVQGARIVTDTGTFSLQIVQGKAFRLVSTRDTTVHYGTYELVPGRMIEVGDGVFTVVDISASKPHAPTTTASGEATSTQPAWRGLVIGLEFELLNTVPYDWQINNQSGGSEEELERSSVALTLGNRYVQGRFGIVTASEWGRTIAGDGGSFENATISEGSGWFIAIGTRVPVFEEGNWSSSVFGEIAYRQEDYALKYGAFGVSGVTTTFSTNVVSGVTNVQPASVTTNLQFTAFDEDATLTETSVRVGVDIAYTRAAFSAYAGLSVFPFVESDLSADVRVAGETFDITFERTHPVIVTAGLTADLLGLTWYIEADAGSETSVRAGLQKEL